MKRLVLPLAAAAALAGCATAPQPSGPQDMFFNRLSALCGRAFEGGWRVPWSRPIAPSRVSGW